MGEARAALVAWLDTLEPVARARVAAVLVDQETLVEVGAVRRAAVWAASRTRPRAEVAAELAVSVSAVAKAIKEHNAAHNVAAAAASGAAGAGEAASAGVAGDLETGLAGVAAVVGGGVVTGAVDRGEEAASAGKAGADYPTAVPLVDSTG